jgi:signal transduction histidine kinase
VEIADTGPGFGPAESERMFEAFFTTKAEGIGLGLWICRTIVEAHGGRLSASSNPPHGSVFRFTVPSPSDRISRDHAT